MGKKSSQKRRKPRQNAPDLPPPVRNPTWADLPSPPGPIQLTSFLFDKFLEPRYRLLKAVVSLISVILLALISPIIVQSFFAALPGPNIYVQIFGMRQKTEDRIICIHYQLMLVTDDPIEHVNAKIKFPNEIDDHAIIFPMEAYIRGKQTVGHMWAIRGKQVENRCAINRSILDSKMLIQAWVAGNTMAINFSKLPHNGIIMGMISTNSQRSTITPVPKNIYTEGFYEYIKSGHVIRKPLRFIDSGITDIKQPS